MLSRQPTPNCRFPPEFLVPISRIAGIFREPALSELEPIPKDSHSLAANGVGRAGLELAILGSREAPSASAGFGLAGLIRSGSALTSAGIGRPRWGRLPRVAPCHGLGSRHRRVSLRSNSASSAWPFSGKVRRGSFFGRTLSRSRLRPRPLGPTEFDSAGSASANRVTEPYG